MIETPEQEWLNYIHPIISSPLCILDADLNIKSINSAFLTVFNVKRGDVLHHPVQKFIQGTGEILQVPRAARQVVEGVIPYAEFVYSRPDTENSLQKYRIRLDPIGDQEETKPNKIEGVLVSVTDITQCHPLENTNTHQASLLNIIHEITSYNHKDNQPGRLIQQLISRIGPVIHPAFVSFIDLHMEQEGWINPYEIALWSNRYGFLIGEGWSRISEDELSEFRQLRHNLAETSPLLFEQDAAPEILRKLMISREVTTALIVPAMDRKTISGCLVLWNNGKIWSDTDITALQTISDIIGAHNTRNRIEGELFRSEEKFRGVIEHIGDMY